MNTPKNTTTPAQSAPPRRPNEHGTISVQGHVKIFDPQTQKIIVEARG